MFTVISKWRKCTALRSNVLRFRRTESSHYPIRCQRERWGSLETMNDNETQQGKQIKEQAFRYSRGYTEFRNCLSDPYENSKVDLTHKASESFSNSPSITKLINCRIQT